MKWPEHGGQPATMKQLFQLDKEKTILDFSANLNPLGPPEWLKKELNGQYESLTRYPDPSYSRSIASLAYHERVGEGEVLLTNGGAEAIFLAAKYFEGKKALILQPTFVEYARACKHYHIETEDIGLLPQDGFALPFDLVMEKLHEKDVLFLCRPNNPTGTVVPEKQIRALLDEGLKTNTYVVVDEAFVDFVPDLSLSALVASYPNLLLLRSLTKMYTIPGIRLGYMMGNNRLINILKAEQIPWSINAYADAIVPKLLEDKRFVDRTKLWLQEQSQKVRSSIASMGFYVSPSRANFYLLQDSQHPQQTDELFRYLFHHGVLARHTHNFKGLDGNFLRLAIRSEEENGYLVSALQKWRIVT
ncbi:threonine-phosphate decarboxylase CobD [Bacillus haimaensis]|uniref:threonine-phosphate decarboxylase CobD n=1 Tax=Bacillus haimaensis TaxID=3160967 RepID=UPI003AA94B4D